MNTYLKWAAAATGVLLPGLGVAQSSTPPADTPKAKRLGSVEVRGTLTPTSKTALSGEATASPASVTLVGRDYVAKQAFSSYGDLLRPLAGLNVTNYQLGGVGYGVQLRGYVGTEHARDIAFSIDGVPRNQGSDIPTNGYTDLNPLIPETLRRMEVIRGPNSPFYGDHALGGSMRFDTEDRLASSVTFSAGTYGTIRGVAIAGFGNRGFRKAGGYVALEENYSAAYRDNNRYQRLNGLAKYSFPLLAGTASVRAQVFSNAFGSANYLNCAAVDAGLLSRPRPHQRWQYQPAKPGVQLPRGQRSGLLAGHGLRAAPRLRAHPREPARAVWRAQRPAAPRGRQTAPGRASTCAAPCKARSSAGRVRGRPLFPGR